MNLNQVKLTKQEWENIEIPVSENDKKILKVIIDGYSNVNIRYNNHVSLLSYLKIEYNSQIELYLYIEYFQKIIDNVVKKLNNEEINLWKSISKTWKPANIKLKSADKIRMDKLKDNSAVNMQNTFIFENALIENLNKITDSDKLKSLTALYTLIYLQKININYTNKYILEFAKFIINCYEKKTTTNDILYDAVEIIEKNKALLKFEDITLYQHQRELYSIFDVTKELSSSTTPKLVLYTAPTGTGKTLSPLGLSCGYKIIFVCVARHVGLSLAKSAISMGKRIAFAFGCETATDIRLHYYAAVLYSVNKRSGGIHRVDNTMGNNVEIIICDVQSYLTAMYYMLSFNDEQDIITYWDEPTITMDYKEHPLHETIQKNWKENKISKMVLSSATLPKEELLTPMIMNFKTKWETIETPEIHTITSYDYKKSLAVINTDNIAILPHNLYENYAELCDCVKNCEQNKTLLRYFDLGGIIDFIKLKFNNKSINYFNKIADITIAEIKNYYLQLLKSTPENEWPETYSYFKETQKNYFGITRKMNGILLTTEDAHTLTDGPTIYLVEDVEKIVNIYIKLSQIPQSVLTTLISKIERNAELYNKITELKKNLEDSLGKEVDKERKMLKRDDRDNNFANSKQSQQFSDTIAALYGQINLIHLEKKYIPNMEEHKDIWLKEPTPQSAKNAFVPIIEEETIKEIMEIECTNEIKIMLLMGVGVFTNTDTSTSIKSTAYTELIKKLSNEQKLFIIVAQPDYIYGTNYQFCHGIIGKDLENITQQKIIQAIGRVGRQNVQQNYTVRFRETANINKLFSMATDNVEAENMCRLFAE